MTLSTVPVSEGTIPLHIPSIGKSCHTWYTVYGDLASGSTPIVGLHGGPGSGHGPLKPFIEICHRHGFPLILYDQIGCGKSTHLREYDHSIWQTALYISDLENVLRFFKLDNETTGYNLLCQEWGAMFGVEFAVRRPPGLRRLVLSGGIASMETFTAGITVLRGTLPADMQAAISDAVEKDNLESPAYQRAWKMFLEKYACFLPTLPEEFKEALRVLSEDPAAHKALLGTKSPWALGGALAEWNIIPLLHRISAPTLVINGEFDTSTNITTKPLFDLIPKVRWVTISGASHCYLFEKREQVLKLVGDFFANTESRE